MTLVAPVTVQPPAPRLGVAPHRAYVRSGRAGLSFSSTVPQPVLAAGLTHASTVIPVLRSSEAASATPTELLDPLKVRTLPYLPVAFQAVFDATPLLAYPDEFAVAVPVPSSKP